MPMHDFECGKCEHVTETLVKQGVDEISCEECGAPAVKIFVSSPKTITAFVPDYPGCKKSRAGYVHTHGDRPSEKIQSGWSGPS